MSVDEFLQHRADQQGISVQELLDRLVTEVGKRAKSIMSDPKSANVCKALGLNTSSENNIKTNAYACIDLLENAGMGANGRPNTLVSMTVEVIEREKRLKDACTLALSTIQGLAEQQAMPDPWWEEAYQKIQASIP